MVIIHASCVALDGTGLMLRGPSGAGKSDLALRLIDDGARLVADDQVCLERSGEQLIASPPPRIAGLLEVRGLGVVRLDHMPSCPVGLVVDLTAPHEVERLPEDPWTDLAGLRLPRVKLAPFEASAVAKLRLARATLRSDDRGLAGTALG